MTRSSRQPDHLLHTPDTFVRAPLPGMSSATAIVHAAPAMGARFTQYTVELERGGSFEMAESQTFVYVIDGEIGVGIDRQRVRRGGFVYRPLYSGVRIQGMVESRVIVIEKPFFPLGASEPAAFIGSEDEVTPSSLSEEKAVEVRRLVPNRFEFDFAVDSMIFAPDAQLPTAEMSVREHGVFMLEGEGIWQLGERSYNVTAGDFLWIAPFCPHRFSAGRVRAKYLIYSDANRHP